MSRKVSKQYDKTYFKWQSSLGEFGGWANITKFIDYIEKDSTVLDFGCGGAFLLNNLECKKKIGIEINPSAILSAKEKGIEVYKDSRKVPDESIDLIISNNALEHTLHPLDELMILHKKLKVGGKVIFVVPCESITYGYRPNDINHHLFSWSPMCIGNLFTEAGFSVIESKPYIHKWPPNFKKIAKFGGRNLFEIACRLYGRIERSWYQVRIIGEKV